MKNDFEGAKLKALGLQADEIVTKHKAFMVAVKNSKSSIDKFEDINIVKTVKKSKKTKYDL